MVITIPDFLPDDAPNSERLVFDLLREDVNAESWVILHSIRPANAPRRRRREVDFLVLIPDLGVLCLEIKGGGFEVENGVWKRPNSPDEPVESPIKQAEAAMYQLKNELDSEFRPEWQGRELPIGCVVLFTDTNWPEGIRESERPVIGLPKLLAEDRNSLAEQLNSIMAGIRDEIPIGRRLPFSPELCRQVTQYFKPDAQLLEITRPAPHGRIERRIVRLTEEQYHSLTVAEENDRCLFTGGAGTGKSMLAMELARRRTESGERVAFVCYNRILGDFLANESITRFKPGSTVGSFWHHFAYDIILQDETLWQEFSSEMDRAENDNPDSLEKARRQQFDTITPEFTRKFLLTYGPQFDYMIVDELQDMCQDPYLEIMDLALRGGLNGGRWAMFCDFNQHTEPRNPHSNIENLKNTAGQYAVHNLEINCRNTYPIVEDSDNVIRIDRDDAVQPKINGPDPRYAYWRDDSELPAILDREVRSLVNQNEDVKQIFVLGTNTLDGAGLDLLNHTYAGYPLMDCPGIYWPIRSRCEQNPCCQVPRDDDSYLKFRTVRRFKGMESKTVILIVDRLTLSNDQKLLYVGLTRARVKLIVLAPEAIKERLERLVADRP